MAYVWGAKRHHTTRLTITPAMEGQIEQDIAPKPNYRGQQVTGLRPCGTLAAYNRHKYRGEPIDEACRTANAQACADRKARKAA